MKAKLVTYTTKGLTGSQKSILSKKMFGYTDKSNKSQYTYHRNGVLEEYEFVKVCNNTFIISIDGWNEVKNVLDEKNAVVTVWDIDIEKL